jgi:hypothetical protein
MTLLAAGCYSPTVANGVACGPDGACPAGQECDDVSGRCYRGPAPVVDAADPGPSDAAPDAEADAPLPDAAPSDFMDDFDRADGSIGGGWIEKSPNVFRLRNGVVRSETMSGGYRDNLVYRPGSERVGDVEIDINFTFEGSNVSPQVFVRADPATI